MSQTDTTPAPPSAGRSLRIWLIVGGGLLWLLIPAALFGTWFLARQREEDRSKLPAIDIEAERAAPIGAMTPNESTGTEAIATTRESDEPGWDPEGIADFELVDMHGKPVTKQDLLGKPWAVCFTFTRCTYTCPRIMGAMYRLQTELQDADVRLVTVTVDPKHDTPEVLRRQAENFAADPDRWWFLTGDQTDIYMLIWKSFKLPVKEMVGEDRKPGFEVLHSNKIMLVDAEGRVVGGYNGIEDEEVAQLRRALLEQAELAAAGSSDATDGTDDAPSGSASSTEAETR